MLGPRSDQVRRLRVNFIDLFWVFLVVSSVLPAVQKRLLETARQNAMRALERLRGSRVITLIHRQESMALLGFPIARYIDIDDSEALLRAIKLTPDTMPLDIVLHTPGGLVLASEQIANALLKHPAKVTVFVPHYAMSGGTLLAMAADEVVMDPHAVLGPVDPQIGQWPAASILSVLDAKPAAEIDDETFILADMARKAQRQVMASVQQLLTGNGMNAAKAESLARTLTSGQWTHDYPIWAEDAQALGLPVTIGIPLEVYRLMDLYPQPSQRQASVQFIPLPYPQPERPPTR